MKEQGCINVLIKVKYFSQIKEWFGEGWNVKKNLCCFFLILPFLGNQPMLSCWYNFCQDIEKYHISRIYMLYRVAREGGYFSGGVWMGNRKSGFKIVLDNVIQLASKPKHAFLLLCLNILFYSFFHSVNCFYTVNKVFV